MWRALPNFGVGVSLIAWASIAYPLEWDRPVFPGWTVLGLMFIVRGVWQIRQARRQTLAAAAQRAAIAAFHEPLPTPAENATPHEP